MWYAKYFFTPDAVILILVIKREQRKGKVVNYGAQVDGGEYQAIRSEQKRLCNFTLRLANKSDPRKMMMKGNVNQNGLCGAVFNDFLRHGRRFRAFIVKENTVC